MGQTTALRGAVAARGPAVAGPLGSGAPAASAAQQATSTAPGGGADIFHGKPSNYGDFHGGTLVAGLFHGKSGCKIWDDDWGYPHDYGNPHI